jgi:sorbitol-specific phosphotransferase system component IIBC
MKQIQIGKEEVMLSLFADDMILNRKDPKKSSKKTIRNINSFGKVARYKIDMQKSVAFLYTNNEQKNEKETRKIIPFIKAKIKYLGINLTKEVKDLYMKTAKP